MSNAGNALSYVHDALMSAFPARDPLEQMLLYRMNISLNTIAGETDAHDQVIHRVVTWADEHGRLGELVSCALTENPGNPELQALALRILNYVNSINRRPRPATVTDTVNLADRLEQWGQTLHEEMRKTDYRVSVIEEQFNRRLNDLEQRLATKANLPPAKLGQWLLGWFLIATASAMIDWRHILGLTQQTSWGISTLLFLLGLVFFAAFIGFIR